MEVPEGMSMSLDESFKAIDSRINEENAQNKTYAALSNNTVIEVESFTVSMDDFLSDAFFMYSVDPHTKTNWYGKQINIGTGKIKLALWIMGAVFCGIVLAIGFVWFTLAGMQTLKRRQRQTDAVFAREL